MSAADLKPVEVYAVGPVSLSACARDDLSIEEVEAEVNRTHFPWPDDRGDGWEFAKGEAFATGEANPCRCNVEPDRLHYLFHC